MTFPTSNMWIEAGPLSLFAKSSHLDTALECSSQWTSHFAVQLHKFTGIRPIN